jgi:glycosyltransferase involved in cell wall biosynthesis
VRFLLLYEALYPDRIGGVETRNRELARALVRRGHRVTLAGLSSPLPGEPPGLDVLSLGPSPRLYNEAGRRSTRGALRFAAATMRVDLSPYDLVESANMPYVHLLPLAARCARAGKPLLVTWYEYWDRYWRGYVGAAKAPAYRAVEWVTAQLGDAAIATSRLTQQRLAARRRRRGEVALLPCGIEVPRVVAAAAAGAADPRPAPPLVYAGRLLAHKRLDLLLRAVPLLAARRVSAPGARLLTVFGEGPDRARLEALTAELGVAALVRFRGHVDTSEEVWHELGRARVAVQPSAREGFGLFPLEAMAAGLPVVHCDSSESAVDELVRDGVEGIGTAATPEALATALGALLADPAARQRLATAARARAAEYDYDVIAAHFEEVAVRLVRASAPPPAASPPARG